MSEPGSVTRMVGQLRDGEGTAMEEAARALWERYFHQLLEQAQRQLSARLQAREDGEDVLQDVYLSFCARLRRGKFTLHDRGDLWRILVTMTRNKARKAAVRHTRERRDYRREVDPAAGPGEAADEPFRGVPGPEPTPDEALALAEEAERRLAALPEDLRRVAVWKLEGLGNDEIAGPGHLDCCTRTVERKLQRIRDIWQEMDGTQPA
jgi:RNA polymerase sigma factor (sigma-70 family)